MGKRRSGEFLSSADNLSPRGPLEAFWARCYWPGRGRHKTLGNAAGSTFTALHQQYYSRSSSFGLVYDAGQSIQFLQRTWAKGVLHMKRDRDSRETFLDAARDGLIENRCCNWGGVCRSAGTLTCFLSTIMMQRRLLFARPRSDLLGRQATRLRSIIHQPCGVRCHGLTALTLCS